MINKKTYEFNIGAIKIPYDLIDSKKVKYIRLLIDIDGLKVTKPYRTKIADVEKVLASKSEWILKHFNKLKSLKINRQSRNWESGETILYLGVLYTIMIYTHQKIKTKLTFNGLIFEVFVNFYLSENDRKISIENEFRKWFKIVALNTIEGRIKHYTAITGLSYNSIKIKEQSTRWGSCSSKGNLNFNWKILMSPQWVIDYVVLHEVCHLKHMNHSKSYWNMVEMYMPDYKNAYMWLKKNTMELNL